MEWGWSGRRVTVGTQSGTAARAWRATSKPRCTVRETRTASSARPTGAQLRSPILMFTVLPPQRLSPTQLLPPSPLRRSPPCDSHRQTVWPASITLPRHAAPGGSALSVAEAPNTTMTVLYCPTSRDPITSRTHQNKNPNLGGAHDSPWQVFNYYDMQLMRQMLRALPGFQWCKSAACGSGQITVDGEATPIVTCYSCKVWCAAIPLDSTLWGRNDGCSPAWLRSNLGALRIGDRSASERSLLQ
jgi:hypothetical protein